MRIRDFKRQALNALSSNWLSIIGISLVFLLLNLVAQVPQFFSRITEGAYLFYVNLALAILIVNPISVGLNWIYLRIVRKEDFYVGQLFECFTLKNAYGRLTGTPVLIGIFTFLWSLLLIIPGIVKSYSYSMSYYILKDRPELGPLEAITESRRIMKGNKGKLFLLDLSFIGWYILGTIPFFIGLLWVVPYHNSARAAFYNQLVQKEQEAWFEDGNTIN